MCEYKKAKKKTPDTPDYPVFVKAADMLANLQTVNCPFVFMQTEVQEQEGSNPMYVNNETDLTAKRIRHLKDRANEVFSEKRAELRKQFNIDDTVINNPAELVDAITKGNFVIDAEKSAKNYGPSYGITFRDLSKPADRPGYEQAKLKLGSALLDLKDVLTVIDPKDGLDALNAFKEWKLS